MTFDRTKEWDRISSSAVLDEVLAEREKQHAKWGQQDHPDGTGGVFLQARAADARHQYEKAFDQERGTWFHILGEEHAEAVAESDQFRLRGELLQVAAVACAWVEAIDRRGK